MSNSSCPKRVGHCCAWISERVNRPVSHIRCWMCLGTWNPEIDASPEEGPPTLLRIGYRPA